MDVQATARGGSKGMLSILAFGLFLGTALTHVVLTNLSGEYFNLTKVLLMPTLAAFFVVTVRDLRRGWPIVWALTGLWLGNICLIWGRQSAVLFMLGTAFTVAGFLGYIVVFTRESERLPVWFVAVQIPILWACAFFVILAEDDLGVMLLPLSMYMTMIAIISLCGLAMLLSHPRSRGAWMMFAGTLFYIAENGLYTADHYIPEVNVGENIVHTCFILAQGLIAGGYLMRERGH